MDCPRCFEQGALAHRGEEPEALGCAGCQGAWLSPAAARRLIEDPFGPLAGLPRVTGGLAALRCPTCREPLARHRVAEVEIDVCTTHGVWFDHREVERVQAAARRPRVGDGLATMAVIGTAVAAEMASSIYAPMSRQAGPKPGEGADAGVVVDAVEVVGEVGFTAVDVAASGADVVGEVGFTAVDVAASGAEAVGSVVLEGGVVEVVGAGVEVGASAFEVLASVFEGLFSF